MIGELAVMAIILAFAIGIMWIVKKNTKHPKGLNEPHLFFGTLGLWLIVMGIVDHLMNRKSK